MNVQTLLQLLSERRHAAAGITFVEPKKERYLSYDELFSKARVRLAELQLNGVSPKEHVVIQLEDNEHFIVSFWACLLGGIIPVPVTVGLTDELRRKTAQICSILECPYLLCTEEHAQAYLSYCHEQGNLEAVDKISGRILSIEQLSSSENSEDRLGQLVEAAGSDVAFIQFSSGSTGDPKGVVLTHHNLLCNMRAIVHGSQANEQDSSLSWLPLTHDMGLIGFHLTPIYAGFHQWQMPTSMFVMNPMAWLHLASRRKITCLSSPNFGYAHVLKHFKPAEAQDLDLSCVRLIYNGAEPISEQISKAFAELLKPYGLQEKSIFPVYGMAEASLAVTFSLVDEPLQALYLDRDHLNIGQVIRMVPGTENGDESKIISVVDLGYPVENCEVKLFDLNGKPVGDERIGLIHIRGGNVTQGYYHHPEANAALITADGWLNTGDLGFVRFGRLFVTGRMKDIIFVNGQNVYPHDLESIASGAKGVELGKVAACGVQDVQRKQDDIALFVQFRSKKLELFLPIRRELQQLINRHTGLNVDLILPVKHIPKTTSGKIQRYLFAEQMRKGEFAEVIVLLEELERNAAKDEQQAQPSKLPLTDGQQRLMEIWREAIGCEQLDVDDHFLEKGGDSLKAAYAAAKIQSSFGVDLVLSELFRYPTIRELDLRLQQLKEQTNDCGISEPINPAGARMHYPTSSAQKRLYILQQMHPRLLNYNLPQALEIQGALSLELFVKAWQALIERHEALRTKIELIDGQAVQRVLPHIQPPVNYLDATAWNEEAVQNYMKTFLRPFETLEAPLFRIDLLQLAENRHLMLFDMHHLITDGTSMGILIKEFASIYDAKALPPLPLQFKDIVVWQEERKQHANMQKHRDYWRDNLLRGIPKLELATDFVRPLQPSYRGGLHRFTIPVELASALRHLAKQTGATLYAALLTGYYMLLSKYTGQKEFMIGTAVSGRTRIEMAPIAGMFVNTLPVRVVGDGEASFSMTLQNVHTQVLEAIEHQEVAYEDILAISGETWDPGRSPLFDTMFTLQNMELPKLQTTDLHFTSIPLTTETSKFDLTWECYSTDNGIEVSLEYALDLFKQESVEQFTRHYVHLLRQAVAEPQLTLAGIELLEQHEVHQLLQTYNMTSTSYPKNSTLQHLFDIQANADPRAIALVMDDEQLTYEELNKQANQWSHWFIQHGVAARSTVAIVLDRSFEMITAILAVLKAGCTYVPIDPNYPTERIQFILKDSGASAIVTQSEFAENIHEMLHDQLAQLPMVLVSELKTAETSLPGDSPAVDATSTDIAYIMYTSGSTGRPKGIRTTHYNVARVVKTTNYIDIKQTDTMLQLSNYAFDGSTFDIFGALLNGAKLILLKTGDVIDVPRLIERIQTYKVSLFFTTTALFHAMIDVDVNGLTGVRNILFGGERASVAHIRKAVQALGPDCLIHVYGPTETTVFSTFYPIHELHEGQVTVPIGKPISNTEVYVLDAEQKLVPWGVPGELFIAGDGLAQGYVNLPELSDSVFGKHPFQEGQRLYKTGDLVRWLGDGNLEFMDRIDTQVKIRGFRIELGEIEHKLAACAGIEEALVTTKIRGGEQILCAYVVAGNPIAREDILQELKQKLPAFMIPASIVQLDKFPLTPNGKIDKSALPEPDQYDSHERVPVVTDAEVRLSAIWKEVLLIEDVGRYDDFFESGGHSLKAATLTSQVYKQFHVKMPISLVFELPELHRQAAWIEQSATHLFQAIQPAPEREMYPITPAQHKVFVLEQFGNVGTAYQIPIALRIEGALERERIEQAFGRLIDRHEPLRTSFHRSGGEVWQKVWKHVPFCVNELTFDENGLEAAFTAFTKPFDLSQAPLINVAYAQGNHEQKYVFISVHHIVSDGISIKALLDEFMLLLDGNALEPLPLQYKDYAVWLETQENSEWMHANDAYWQEKLAGPLPILDMPTDYPRGDLRTFDGDVIALSVPETLTGHLHHLAEQNGLTLNSILFAVYSVLLYKYTSQNEMVIGSLSAGRTHPDVQQMGGMFNQFLPIHLQVDPEADFMGYVRSVQRQLLHAYEHQDASMAQLHTGIPYDSSRNPLFDTMLIVHNQFESDIRLQGELCGLFPEVIHTKTAKLDFKVDIYEFQTGCLSVVLEYNTALFRSETMERLGNYFLFVLEQVAKNPLMPCASVSLISKDETEMILRQFNDTYFDHPTHSTLYEGFEMQAAASPEQVAITSAEGSLTYRLFNEKANRLARYLREKGVTRDTVVPMIAERSLSMMVGIMAILKAGGAYLPIEPTLPEERILYMLADSDAAVVCMQGKWRSSIGHPGTVIDIDEEEAYRHLDSDNLPAISGPDHLAYVIYTSGSTGKPKGVMIEHRAILNRLLWMQRQYPLTSGDVILQKTPITFDVSVWELFWWGMVGASVYLLEPGGEKAPQTILKVLEEQRVSVLHFVPSMLNVFLEYIKPLPGNPVLPELKYVFTSGEALKPHHVKQFASALNADHPTVKLVNLYGPTEAAVDVSWYECISDEGSEVPIGKPIDNLQLYVVNDHLQLQPIGVPGELCIAGAGLARGYWRRDELTNEKFVPNPFEPGGKMYKTGDRASWLPDGNIAYWGRIDTQVKIRGIRIECGEIEHALLQLAGVREAVVIAAEDRLGEQELCAYLVADSSIHEQDVKQALGQTLPYYMVPAVIVQIEQIPLSSNGKMDRNKLPKPRLEQLETVDEPRTETEKQLAELWRDVLGVQRIGMNSHFFALGGHSLRAAQLSGRVEQRFHVHFSLKDLFQAPTLGQMAQFVEASPRRSFLPLAKAEPSEVYPLSLAQNRLFILQHVDAGRTVYHLPFAMLIEGAVDLEKLRNSIQRLTERHEPLRTSFEWRHDTPVQRIHDKVELELELWQANEEEIPSIVKQFIRPFDLGAAPLLRAGLVQLAATKHVLLMDMHHIVSDGLSMVILAQEFVNLYQGQTLAPLAIQYKDAAVWQQTWMKGEERAQQERFWSETLAGELPMLNMPTDQPRPAWQSFEGGMVTDMLPADLVERMNRLADSCEVTPYMLLFSVFHVLLYKLTGQTDLIVGTPVNGRFHPETEPLAGMFVNTLPIRSKVDANERFLHFVGSMKERILQAFAHDSLPFEHCVNLLDVERDPSRNPVFDVMFVLQNMGIPHVGVDGLRFSPYAIEHPVSKLDLTFELIPQAEAISVRAEYATRLFAPGTIKRLIQHYRYLLESVVAMPAVTLSELRLQSPQDEQDMLMALNRGQVPYEAHRTIESYLEECAEIEPGRVAATFRDQVLTYGELNAKANQLAHILRQNGVGSEDLVAVCIDRSLEMLISLYAILKSGAGYVPISTQMPEERVRFVLDDSRAKLLLVHRPAEQETGALDIPILDFSEMDLAVQPPENLPKRHHSRNIAYVIYTSGSTGQPKGVMVEHHSVINRIGWMQKAYPLRAQDIILQKTPTTFDVSVWELFWWSFAGAGVCLLEPEGEKNPQCLVNTLIERKISVMHFVPSMLHLFLDYAEEANLGEATHRLTHVFASGEALTPDLVKRFRSVFRPSKDTKLINLYGPTEATVDVSYYDCDNLESEWSVPIGRPIDNIQLFVVNESLQCQPYGVPGELCISGAGVARGYLNREDLTAERFVPNPFVPGTVMYRTGDLVKLLSDGNIEYLGRLDHQVKIRGYRVELGEIESEIIRHPGVKEAVVMKRNDRQGEPYLCAYLVGSESLTVAELRRHLAVRMPEYMIPSAFVALPELPLTASGKVDRKRLPEPDHAMATGTHYVEASKQTEMMISEVWKELLGQSQISVHDNFFEIGGDSLLLIRAHQKLEHQFAVSFPVADLFNYPTIAKLAEHLDALGRVEQKWAWEGLKAPSSYAAAGYSANWSGSFEFMLDRGLWRQWQEIGQHEHVGPKELAFAAFFIYWRQISQQNQLVLPFLRTDAQIVPVEVDFTEVRQFSDLLQTLGKSERVAGQSFDIQQVSKTQSAEASSGTSFLYPVLYWGPIAELKSDQELLHVFDLVLAFEPRVEDCYGKMIFNERRLNKEKLKAWMQGYVKLMHKITDQYRNAVETAQKESAAGRE